MYFIVQLHICKEKLSLFFENTKYNIKFVVFRLILLSLQTEFQNFIFFDSCLFIKQCTVH